MWFYTYWLTCYRLVLQDPRQVPNSFHYGRSEFVFLFGCFTPPENHRVSFRVVVPFTTRGSLVPPSPKRNTPEKKPMETKIVVWASYYSVRYSQAPLILFFPYYTFILYKVLSLSGGIKKKIYFVFFECISFFLVSEYYGIRLPCLEGSLPCLKVVYFQLLE